jgi:hypothetical protein
MRITVFNNSKIMKNDQIFMTDITSKGNQACSIKQEISVQSFKDLV